MSRCRTESWRTASKENEEMKEVMKKGVERKEGTGEGIK